MLNVQGNLRNGFFTDSVLITRRSYTINDYGENVLTESAPFYVDASVQPVKGKELEFLPEFVLETSTLKFFTLEPLYTESNSTGYSDKVIYNGQSYQIIQAQQWKTHCESIGYLEQLSE